MQQRPSMLPCAQSSHQFTSGLLLLSVVALYVVLFSFVVYEHIRTSGVLLHSSYSGIRLPDFSITLESLGVCIAATAAVAATATSADAAPTASSAAAFVTSTAAATAAEVQHMY